ncbi:hypothetical protein, conserved in T. vivax [Trypanosoma vivax Y486]|uniref:Uncharacterized protein n=1 Tax=Trypanosoma vivax (strain Y486) TaxID=1055687 RepID=F9WMV8_TRYVY|nr:hypothetical protein, conserved in T. vivax [Trypanosoma vivax Y486]|eukprot:CCD18873.1 hypothetical protein, conserved in T. vivax [Trypanosoma vivax Y486]
MEGRQGSQERHVKVREERATGEVASAAAQQGLGVAAARACTGKGKTSRPEKTRQKTTHRGTRGKVYPRESMKNTMGRTERKGRAQERRKPKRGGATQEKLNGRETAAKTSVGRAAGEGKPAGSKRRRTDWAREERERESVTRNKGTVRPHQRREHWRRCAADAATDTWNRHFFSLHAVSNCLWKFGKHKLGARPVGIEHARTRGREAVFCATARRHKLKDNIAKGWEEG